MGSTATTRLPTDNEVAVRPGDSASAAEVEGWLRDYAASRDPELRERIILAYLGLADRRAARYGTSRGTTLEDLTQTARAGLVAAVDRYDTGHGAGFVPFAVASVVGGLKRYLRDTSWRVHVPGRSRTGRRSCTGPLTSWSRPWAGRPPPGSSPITSS